jgi:hypothetical protein
MKEPLILSGGVIMAWTLSMFERKSMQNSKTIATGLTFRHRILRKIWHKRG